MPSKDAEAAAPAEVVEDTKADEADEESKDA